MRDLERFEVLSRAKEMARECYRLSSCLPNTERFGLTSQMNRAAVSVVANIAEGIGRGRQGDLEHHLRISAGSAAELHVLADLASDLHPLPPADAQAFVGLVDSVRRQITRLTVKVAEER